MSQSNDHETGKPRDVLQSIHDGKAMGNVAVPCDGCAACCRSPNITVQLTPEEAARLPRHVEKDGRTVLAKRADGGCSYLDSNNRCEVYAERPEVCRLYDCRLWALLDIKPVGDEEWKERIESWRFDLTDKEDRALVTKLRNAASQAKGSTARDIIYGAADALS